MAIITWGGADVPDGSDDADIAALWLTYANSFRATQVPYFATKADRNTAASSLPVGHHAICLVGGNVGACWYNGTAWINLSPPKVYTFVNSYASGWPVTTGSSFTDSSLLSIPNVVNAQIIDVDIRARIRINGSSRQSILVKVIPSAGTLPLTYEDFVMAQQAFGDGTEWTEYTKYSRFYCDNGTVTFAPYLAAGAGPDQLVLSWFQMKATVYPFDAA